MNLLNIDFRFFESKYELSQVQELINIVENQISEKEHEYKQNYEQAIKSLSEEERDIERQKYYYFIDEFLPRFFRNPIILILWALIETVLIELTNEIRTKEKIKLKLSDIRGDNFIDRVIKYSHHILKYDLFNDGKFKQSIDELRILRNAIAHSNGRIEFIKNIKDKRKINKLCNSKSLGIENVQGNIVISKQYLYDSNIIIQDFLKSKISELLEKYSK